MKTITSQVSPSKKRRKENLSISSHFSLVKCLLPRILILWFFWAKHTWSHVILSLSIIWNKRQDVLWIDMWQMLLGCGHMKWVSVQPDCVNTVTVDSGTSVAMTETAEIKRIWSNHKWYMIQFTPLHQSPQLMCSHYIWLPFWNKRPLSLFFFFLFSWWKQHAVSFNWFQGYNKYNLPSSPAILEFPPLQLLSCWSDLISEGTYP